MSEAAIAAVISLAEKAMTGMTDEAQMKALCEAFAADAKKLTEGGPVTVNVAGGLTAADVAAAVAKQLAERDDAAKKLAETQAGNVKLLGEQIAELGKSLSEDTRKELVDGLTPAITAEMSAPAIKALAEVQVKMAEKAEANKQLAASGFHFRGNAHITVDSTNEVLKLQETIDRRLGITPPKDSPNAELVKKVLAQFDVERGAELSREHKHLAAGDGIISDVSVPAIFERTVYNRASQ